MYLLDTDIVVFAIRGNKAVLQRLGQLSADQWGISAITSFEIQKGIEANPTTRSSTNAQEFLAAVEPWKFDSAASTRAARVFQQLRTEGITIGTADEMIAGHALSMKAILVTNNQKHFERVPGLKLESWL